MKQDRYSEHMALAILNIRLPEFAANLFLDESPDLQTADRSLGIEVVEAIDSGIAQIDGEYKKVEKSICESDKVKRIKKIEKNGAKYSQCALFYPGIDSKQERETVLMAFRKKVEKLASYRKNGFKQLGVLVFMDTPPIPYDPAEYCEAFLQMKVADDFYDFAFLLYPCALVRFDFNQCNKKGGKPYRTFEVDKDKFDELRAKTREAFY